MRWRHTMTCRGATLAGHPRPPVDGAVETKEVCGGQALSTDAAHRRCCGDKEGRVPGGDDAVRRSTVRWRQRTCAVARPSQTHAAHRRCPRRQRKTCAGRRRRRLEPRPAGRPAVVCRGQSLSPHAAILPVSRRQRRMCPRRSATGPDIDAGHRRSRGDKERRVPAGDVDPRRPPTVPRRQRKTCAGRRGRLRWTGPLDPRRPPTVPRRQRKTCAGRRRRRLDPRRRPRCRGDKERRVPGGDDAVRRSTVRWRQRTCACPLDPRRPPTVSAETKKGVCPEATTPSAGRRCAGDKGRVQAL